MNKQQAINILKQCGILIPYDDNLKLYHGRSSKQDEIGNWVVNPNYDNGSAGTNVNVLSALNVTPEKDRAQDFADVRSIGDMGTPEVYSITTTDKDAMIFNMVNLDSILKQYDENSQKLIRTALRTITNFTVSETMPFKYEERELYNIIVEAIHLEEKHDDGGKKSWSEKNARNIYERAKQKNPNITREMVNDVVGASNMRSAILKDPHYALDKYVFYDNKDPLKYLYGGGRGPLNFDYLVSWLANNHIVGVKTQVSSATIGKPVDTCFLFDMSNINTQKANGDKLQQTLNTYGPFAELFDDLEGNQFVSDIANMTPKEIVEYLKSKHKSCEQLLGMNSGVWEGFTIGEHTETVLRLFDNSYDEMPDQLKSLMRLSALTHDVGKGVAVSKGEKEKQDYWNRKYIQDLLSYLGIDQKYIDIIQFITIDSQKYTSAHYVHNDPNAMDKLRTESLRAICDKLGIVPSDEMVNGLIECCKAMQTCDSGAYTRYAVTRDEKTNTYYYNANDRFTEGMTLINGKIRFKKDVGPIGGMNQNKSM